MLRRPAAASCRIESGYFSRPGGLALSAPDAPPRRIGVFFSQSGAEIRGFLHLNIFHALSYKGF
ncbi:hypothetical protein BEN74_11640 [Acinetobacter sp. WCHAc010034]|nr:hypothetical protein BEN74_11640 [Acinetobacter sp. WCHAc010034]